ncbi:MAG: hypothetical protein HQK91_03910 [Nitrospirae bacterium]|nr:hypothetical protein [Nitrospirota bacterium]MBF0540582.1 hypothetical protein [Nitrospirota bacterium]
MNCSLCLKINPNSNYVDEAILQGTSLRSIALRFKISRNTLARHKTHITKTLIETSLHTQIKELKEKTMSILNQVEQEKDYRAALLAIKEARVCLEALSKLEGEHKSDNKILSDPLPQSDKGIQINIIMP